MVHYLGMYRMWHLCKQYGMCYGTSTMVLSNIPKYIYHTRYMYHTYHIVECTMVHQIK